MKIETIGIIGGTQGLGARFVKHFKAQFPDRTILFSGRSTSLTNEALVRQSDLVIFAVPIESTISVIERLVDQSRPDQIWMDFTSVKQEPVEAMLQSKAEVLGGHPLFGPLPVIKGQPFIYCPARISDDSLALVLELFEDFDSFLFTPKEHDDLMGVIQCVSHFSDMVMGDSLRKSGFDFQTLWDIASPAYRLKLQVMGRMFGQNPKLYANIATYNSSSNQYIKIFMESAQTLYENVKSKNSKAFVATLESNQAYLGKDFCDKSYKDSQKFLSYYVSGSAADNLENIKKLRGLDAVVFGDPHSHTDVAAHKMLDPKASRDYVGHIFQVFEAVEQGLVKRGIVPYENSTQGSIFATLDELFDHPEIQIVRHQVMAISQNLLGLPGSKIEDITTVMSHPQALGQSHNFLKDKLKNAHLETAASTALASQKIVEEGDLTKASIGSATLAESLGLVVLAADMQEAENETRFIEIAKKNPPEDSQFTSFVCWFAGDSAGNLAQLLTFFAQRNINLMKLDSRRASKDYGKYLFFIDAELSIHDFGVMRKEIEALVAGVRVLGGF